MNDLTTGAKVVLGATIAFLIVSFLTWFDYSGPGSEGLDALGVDTGITMWHGVGWVAGLLAIVLLVWQVLRLANIEFEVGVTPSMITAALALLILIFTVIRVLDGYDFADRTIWLWLGLVFSIVIAVGAWMNMQAAGESFTDVRASLAGAASAARGSVDRDNEAAPPPPPPSPSEPPPPADMPADDPDAPRAP